MINWKEAARRLWEDNRILSAVNSENFRVGMRYRKEHQEMLDILLPEWLIRWGQACRDKLVCDECAGIQMKYRYYDHPDGSVYCGARCWCKDGWK